MNDIRRKIDLYILSLGLLFIFFLIISTKLPEDQFIYGKIEAWKSLVIDNPLPALSLLGLVYCAFAYLRFNFQLKGSTELPFEISKIEDINYEHLTFLATYVVPLISFNFSSGRQMLVLILLLVVMGTIYIKTDLFYANPSLALLGFRIYRANGNFKTGDRENIILICRERLSEGQMVCYIKLDNRIYYVSGGKNER